MNLFGKHIHFKTANAIAFLLIVFTILLFAVFFRTKDPQYSSLISGLATGFALATIQFFFSWYEYAKIDKFQKMKIKDIRPNRDNRDLYQSLIEKSQREILILGVTATRLINDFADAGSNQAQNKVLLTALSRGVEVKILLPNKQFLESNQQPQFDITKASFEIIKSRHPNFSFKYFDHMPSHSIFLTDNECIVGPVFPRVSSRNTPSLYVESTSPFAETYLTYFRGEWQ